MGCREVESGHRTIPALPPHHPALWTTDHGMPKTHTQGQGGLDSAALLRPGTGCVHHTGQGQAKGSAAGQTASLGGPDSPRELHFAHPWVKISYFYPVPGTRIV